MTGIYLSFDPNAPTTNKIFHQLHEFNIIMRSLVLNSDNDSISWSASSDNLYSVKSCYALLNDGGFRSQHGMDIWKCSAPLKIKVFTWLVIHDKILSKENLVKKGWLGSLFCVFCDYAVESTMYIFCSVKLLGVWAFFCITLSA